MIAGDPLRGVGVCIATFFGVGKSPLAPGTAGSLAALPIIWLIHSGAGNFAVVGFAVLALVAGTWAADMYVGVTQEKDPASVVIDEVAGQAIAISFLPLGLVEYGIAFVLFRIFDITKPWPANYVDQRLTGGVGIMLDDVVAGLYAGVASLGFMTVIG